jgi:hypothetical protein
VSENWCWSEAMWSQRTDYEWTIRTLNSQVQDMIHKKKEVVTAIAESAEQNLVDYKTNS